MSDEAKWFVIRSNQSQELHAFRALKADHVEAYLPMIVRETRKGIVAAPMFASYLFVRLPMVSDLWRKVFTARGVNCVITWDGRLSPIADRVVSEVKSRERDGYVRMSLEAEPVHQFQKGELVLIKKGPFAMLQAVFQEPVAQRRCSILLRLLGDSPRLAQIDARHLERVA